METEEGDCLSGKDPSPKPAELVTVTHLGPGSPWANFRKAETIPGQGTREAEFQGLGKFREVMASGYIYLVGYKQEPLSFIFWLFPWGNRWN